MVADIRFGSGFHKRNPDVLTCIASLSNDEVFTPPALANQMLDSLADGWASINNGENIWSRSDLKFLDPFTKSGVFLREITKRLTQGLEHAMPDLEKRVDHILTKQVYGIGITELTAHLARRSLYCSKDATGKHSVATSFKNSNGNVWFESLEHTWVGGTQSVETADKQGNPIAKKINGRCRYCGANQSSLERSIELETYAYSFIHTENAHKFIAEIYGEEMQFDVIIGNPPYQLNDGGGEGSSAIPLYNKFVAQAIKLDPTFLTMVIPARWYSGGRGLDEFRASMLGESGISQIHDFPETDMVFPGVTIRGGVCYFLWNKNFTGDVEVVNYGKSKLPTRATRKLLEPGATTFVRYNDAIDILRKIRSHDEITMDTRVQSSNPFGMRSNFSDFSIGKTKTNTILLYRSRRGSEADKEVYIKPSSIESNFEFVKTIRVIVSKASPGGDEYPHSVFSNPIISGVNSASTETYLIVDFVKNELEAEHLISYLKTRFFRFLVALIKNTQNISKSSFAFVPVQDYSEFWSDEKLYAKYGITEEEIAFIESMIRPMGAENE